MLIDLISYDYDVLKDLSSNELFIQMIARQDLKRPHREGDLADAAFKVQVQEATRAFVESLRGIHAHDIADEIATLLDAYQGGDE